MSRQSQSRRVFKGASGSPARGFTLVELLVVITIIASLVGILLPAVQAAREAARRNTCTNNQHQLSLALINYESAHRAFPGYVNQLAGGATPFPASWVVTILPLLERKDLSDQWQTEITTSGVPATTSTEISLAVLQCPSDLADSPSGALSYVVNRGRNGVNNNPAVGVCFNQFRTGSAAVNMDYMGAHDGSTNTLLLAESLMTPITRQGRTAAATQPTTRPYLFIDQTVNVTSGLSEANTTVTPTTFYSRPFPKWYSPFTNTADNAYGYDTTSASPVYTLAQAASLCEVDLGFEWSTLGFGVYSGTTSASGGFNVRTVPNASIGDQIGSRHGGIFMVAFCDGHVSRLQQAMSVDVFRQLMTPWGEGYTTRNMSATPPEPTQVTNDGPNAVLDDASF